MSARLGFWSTNAWSASIGTLASKRVEGSRKRYTGVLMSHYLALDLGAESGRALLGSLSGGKLAVEELHRFPNIPVRALGALYWDTLRLWHEIQHGIGVATRQRQVALRGIRADTWGGDCALLGSDGTLLENPRHYRDARNNGM